MHKCTFYFHFPLFTKCTLGTVFTWFYLSHLHCFCICLIQHLLLLLLGIVREAPLPPSAKAKTKVKTKTAKNDPWQEKKKKKQEQAKRGRREKRKRCGFEVRAERLSSGWFMFYAATSSPFDLNVRCLSVINEITLLLFFGVSCFCFFTCIFYYIS